MIIPGGHDFRAGIVIQDSSHTGIQMVLIGIPHVWIVRKCFAEGGIKAVEFDEIDLQGI